MAVQMYGRLGGGNMVANEIAAGRFPTACLNAFLHTSLYSISFKAISIQLSTQTRHLQMNF